MSDRKQEGVLVYNYESDRYDIRFSLTDYYGGLHCGQCFDVKIKNNWFPVRIEMGEDWYLVGFEMIDDLQGLSVRI